MWRPSYHYYFFERYYSSLIWTGFSKFFFKPLILMVRIEFQEVWLIFSNMTTLWRRLSINFNLPISFVSIGKGPLCCLYCLLLFFLYFNWNTKWQQCTYHTWSASKGHAYSELSLMSNTWSYYFNSEIPKYPSQAGQLHARNGKFFCAFHPSCSKLYTITWSECGNLFVLLSLTFVCS